MQPGEAATIQPDEAAGRGSDGTEPGEASIKVSQATRT